MFIFLFTENGMHSPPIIYMIMTSKGQVGVAMTTTIICAAYLHCYGEPDSKIPDLFDS